jgi:hypothetical protein
MATISDFEQYSKEYTGQVMVWVLNKILEMGKVPRSEGLNTTPNSKGKIQAKELVIEAMVPKSFLFFKQKLKISIEPIMDDRNPDAVYFNEGECLVKVTVKDLFKTKYSLMLSSQLIDALETGRMLDDKLQWKLDMLLGGKSMSYTGNKLIID